MPASTQPEIVFDGHAAMGEGRAWAAGSRGLLWLGIPDGRAQRFDPAAGSDDVSERFRVREAL